MEFWNFIRNIFGGQNLEKSKDKGFSYHQNYDRGMFDNSTWHNDADYNDIDSRFFEGNSHFHIFSNPLEMSRYFESQIDNILKNFIFGVHGGDGTNILPFSSPERKNLRDKMLKPNTDHIQTKFDSDLDGKITVDNFSHVWDDHSDPKLKVAKPHIIGKFMRKEYVRRSDGTIEEKQVISDHEGNEETIISHRIGDKMHTVVTKKDKHGVESKIENFFNISECESSGRKELPSNEKNDFHDDLNSFPWEKFFKPDPKL